MYKGIKAELLHITPIQLVEAGGRISHDSIHKMGDKDKVLTAEGLLKCDENHTWIEKIAVSKGHSSILEHCNMTFHLVFPRNVLQEFSRHRVGVSPTVKSTRYTLNELIKLLDRLRECTEANYAGIEEENCNVRKYIYSNISIDMGLTDFRMDSNYVLEFMYSAIYEAYLEGYNTPDKLKNFLPECWMTEGLYTINLRALRHLFKLRSDTSAFEPFRILCNEIYLALPNDVRGLL